MSFIRFVASTVGPAVLVVIAACSSTPGGGTSTEGPPQGSGSGSGTGRGTATGIPGSSPSTGTGSASVAFDAGFCVDLNLAPDESTCSAAGDCTIIPSDAICPGYGPNTICWSGVANQKGLARIQAEITTVPAGPNSQYDFCDVMANPPPRCIQGQCNSCVGVNRESPGCFDAGVDATADGAVGE